MPVQIRSAITAAERQMQFRDWLTRRTPGAIRSRRWFIEAFTGNHPQTALDVRRLTQNTLDFLDNEHACAQHATPVYVTASALDIINEAAALLPNDEILLTRERDLQTLMLWFEQPLAYTIGEVKYDDGTTGSEDWQVEMITISPVEDMGRTADGSEIIDRGPGIQITLYATHPQDATVFAPIDMIGIRCDHAWNEHPRALWITEMKRWVIAMYRLMGDHIERSNVSMERAARRRLERAGFPVDGYVTELRLRKVYIDGDEGEWGPGAPLRFRHRVRGHWRKFYCSSMGGVGDPAAYRHRYVNDYVRGPKGERVIESQRVVTLAR